MLFEKLEKDIEERQNVLFEIERVLFTSRYSLSTKHFEIFTVQSVTMIYSIWEGFIQNAFNNFIDYINKMHIDRKDIKDELFMCEIEKNFKQFNELPKRQNRKLAFYKDLDVFFQNPKLTLSKGVYTENNVSFEVLNNIMKSFCLETFDEHWKNYSYPNTSLKNSLTSFIRYRNGVSHGGDISSEEKVTQQVYEKYKNLVLDLMYEIIIRMDDGIKSECYIK